jgi:hypothetical protein
MADNISVKDASNNNITLATTESGGVHTTKHIISSALPAGTNNIGDVDVLTVPADPFGLNADAAVAAGAAGSIQAKLRRLTTDIGELQIPALTPKYQLVTASGNTTVIAATASVKTKVAALVIHAQGTVTVSFTDGTGGAALNTFYLVAGVPIELPLVNRKGQRWFETSTNTLLAVNLSAAVNVSIQMLYFQEA